MNELTAENFIRISSLEPKGIDSLTVQLEFLRSKGIPQLSITGLPGIWIRDSKDKLRSLVMRHYNWKALDRILIHLLPAGQNKEGSHLELPLVLGCLALLSPQPLNPITLRWLNEVPWAGGISLEGHLIDTPVNEAFENRLIKLSQFGDLRALWTFLLSGKSETPLGEKIEDYRNAPDHSEELSPILEVIPKEPKGLLLEKLLIYWNLCAEHPIFLIGPPGGGKSMLAKWASRLLPEPTANESRQITRLWTLCGRHVPKRRPLLMPPSRTQLADFVGQSYRGLKRPGFFTLAHRGLLILDEFTEHNRDVREILREVLEQKKVERISNGCHESWPANFWLIGTSNPCPCGMVLSDGRLNCRCSSSTRQKYLDRLSGPIMDRMGLRLWIGGGELSLNCNLRDELLSILEPLRSRFYPKINYDLINEDYKSLCDLDESSEEFSSMNFSTLPNISARQIEICRKLSQTAMRLLPNCSQSKLERSLIQLSLSNPVSRL